MGGDGRLTIDRLPDPADPVEVYRFEGVRLAGSDVREPHRHDYHELMWLRSGHGEHLLDGPPGSRERCQGSVTSTSAQMLKNGLAKPRKNS